MSRSRTRAGLSLLEVVIAMAIFAVFLVGAMEAMSSMRSLATVYERTDDQEREGRRILRTFTNDLSNSAWLFTADYDSRAPAYPTVTRGGSQAYGDAIEFVKLRTERTLSNDPRGLHVERVNFADPGGKPVRFSDYHHAPAVKSLVLNTTYQESRKEGVAATYLNDVYVATVWESGQGSQTFQQNADPRGIRVYRYEVRVSQRTGLGELVRLYRNQAAAPWQVTDVLSEHVLEFEVELFDTPGTAAGLNMNQVRFRLVLERPGDAGTARTRRAIEAVVAMRSITTDASN